MTRRTRKRFQRSRFDSGRRPRGTLAAAGVLLAFMVVVNFAAPDTLPLFFHRVVALANAVLAMLVAVFAIREFGRSWNRLSLPVIGRFSVSKIVGAVVFAAVFALWFTRWAPIEAG